MAQNISRFQIAQGSPTPTADQLETQQYLRELVASAGDFIEEAIPASREQSLALTKLEEALMWGGKAIFKSSTIVPEVEAK